MKSPSVVDCSKGHEHGPTEPDEGATMPSRFITDKEAARLLGIKPEDVRRAVREGRLPGVVIHRKAVRINVDALAAWRATEGGR